MFRKNIIWLASYPKSGNTWFRVFLTNLLSNSEEPANINDLKETSISSSRKIFDDYTGLSSSDLTHQEIDRLRPDVYRMQSAETNDLLFKKAHDKYLFVDENKALFPEEITKCAIYFIRNPLDVAVSFAYHNNKPIAKMIEGINDSTYAFCDSTKKLHNQLRQILGSWSDHAESWINQKNIPVKVIRYEDMVESSFSTFKSAVDFIGLDKSDQEIKNAIEKSDFSVLTNQEKENGFREKMIKSKAFFRKGKIGDYKNHLNQDMIEEIVNQNKQLMLDFGYLDENNQLLI